MMKCHENVQDAFPRRMPRFTMFRIASAGAVFLMAFGGGTCGTSPINGGTGGTIIGPGGGGTAGGGGGGTGGNGGGGPTILASDHVLGSSGAPVTVIEYLDFQ
jgi:hypothetical protein